MTDVADWNRQIIEEFRANQGQVGGPFAGMPMLLLTTTGARTGRQHTTPTAYLDVDGRRFVFASKAGAPDNPDWYHNLKANPTVTVEIGADRLEARAEEVTGAERDRLYATQVERIPGFAEYQEKTDRVIPVIELVTAS